MGDRPITTYFSIRPCNGRKRKPEVRANSLKSTKKLKSEVTKAPNKATKADTLELQQAPTGSSASIPLHSCDGGDARVSMYSLTPDPTISTVLKQYNDPEFTHIISTPAATRRLKKKRSALEALVYSSSLGSESSNHVSRMSPMPMTWPRSHSRQPHNLPEDVDTPCKSSHSTTGVTRFSANYYQILSDNEDSIGVISSQSQNTPEQESIPKRQARNAVGSSSMPIVIDSSFPSPPRSKDSRRSISSESGTDQIILSSQSQLINPFDYSPRKKRRKEHRKKLEPEVFNEKIPSSQSQEMELIIPHEDDDTCTEDETDTRAGSSKSNIPARTPSDLMFPIPIRKKVLAGIFSKREFARTHNAKSSNESSFTDSETESDSSNTENLAPPHPRSRSQTIPPQQDHTPVEADSLEDPERITPLEPTSELSENDESQGGSLPLAFEDFQEVYVDDDESYPPDFPMSLRI